MIMGVVIVGVVLAVLVYTWLTTIEINPGDTEVSRIVDYRLRVGAAEAMTRLWARLHPPG